MKRLVSGVASLALVMAMAAACSAAKAGKAEFSEVCMQKMGGSQAKCSCYVDSVMAGLEPDQFSKAAQAVFDNRQDVGMVPEALQRDTVISTALNTAAKACFV